VQTVLKVLVPNLLIPSNGPFSYSRSQRCRKWPRHPWRGYRSSPYPHKTNRWFICVTILIPFQLLIIIHPRKTRWHPRRHRLHLPRRTHRLSPIPRWRIHLHLRLPRILGLSRHSCHHHAAVEHRLVQGHRTVMGALIPFIRRSF